MMYILNLMEQKNMTRAELSRISMVPESTLRDILNGTSQVEHCEAITLALIADVLDTTVEEILNHAVLEENGSDFESDYEEENEDETEPIVLPNSSVYWFYLFLYALKEDFLGKNQERTFCNAVKKGKCVETFWNTKAYSSALLLVGIADYFCRKNKWPLIPEYEKYRHMRLKRPIYPYDMFDPDMTYQEFESEMNRVETFAIPELARMNIFLTEKDIRKKK